MQRGQGIGIGGKSQVISCERTQQGVVIDRMVPGACRLTQRGSQFIAGGAQRFNSRCNTSRSLSAKRRASLFHERL